jgi:hypothetical protein
MLGIVLDESFDFHGSYRISQVQETLADDGLSHELVLDEKVLHQAFGEVNSEGMVDAVLSDQLDGLLRIDYLLLSLTTVNLMQLCLFSDFCLWFVSSPHDLIEQQGWLRENLRAVRNLWLLFHVN